MLHGAFDWVQFVTLSLALVLPGNRCPDLSCPEVTDQIPSTVERSLEFAISSAEQCTMTAWKPSLFPRAGDVAPLADRATADGLDTRASAFSRDAGLADLLRDIIRDELSAALLALTWHIDGQFLAFGQPGAWTYDYGRHQATGWHNGDPWCNSEGVPCPAAAPAQARAIVEPSAVARVPGHSCLTTAGAVAERLGGPLSGEVDPVLASVRHWSNERVGSAVDGDGMPACDAILIELGLLPTPGLCSGQ